MGYKFEWDVRKAESNARKHGVTFDEASTVFGDPLSLLKPDPERRGAILVTWHVNSAAAYRRSVCGDEDADAPDLGEAGHAAGKEAV
jgi:uncharacterized DUF497 family protein